MINSIDLEAVLIGFSEEEFHDCEHLERREDRPCENQRPAEILDGPFNHRLVALDQWVITNRPV